MFKIILGIVIGAGAVLVIKSRLDSRLRGNDTINNPNAEGMREKQENLQKVLELVRGTGEISNEDVQKALGVSNSSAFNYLQELEKQGKLEQIGAEGRFVRYRLK